MKFLVIYDYDGEIKYKFPVNHSRYEVVEGELHVERNDALYVFRLDRYSYAIEDSKRVKKERALA